jgi:ATP-dependent DNA ligase
VLVEDGLAAAYSKSGHDWSDRYPRIVARAARLRCQSAILDGEVILPDANGAADFAGLPSAIRRQPDRLVFMAFDLLHLDGADLKGIPLLERKMMLKRLLKGRTEPIIYVEHLKTDGERFFAACEELGLEGMVSKITVSRYRSGPNKNWLKTKCYTVSEFDLIGTTITSQGHHVALLEARGTGEYAGTAFINLKRDKRELLRDRIQSLRRSQPRGTGTKSKETRWLKPGLVASVRHLRGEEGLRHASILDIRDRNEDADRD